MKNNRILIVGAGLAVALVLLGACGGRSGEKEYSKAMKAWEKGNLVQARTLFEKSTARLSSNDRKSMAFNNLGLVLWQLDEPAAAESAFSDACTLSENITEARLNLAIAQFHTGNLNGAKMSLGMYLGENPDNETALAMQSLIAAKKRDWAGASKILSKSATADPTNPELQNALALAEAKGGQSPEQAASRLKQLVAAHPDYAPAFYNLAVISDLMLHDKAAALTYYKSYLQKAGENASHSATAKSAVARLSGKASTTVAASDPVAAQQFMKQGDNLFSEKKYAEALAQYQRAATADPSQKEAHYRQGLASFYLGDFANVQNACRHALAIDPSYADARYLITYSYVQQKKWDDAEREAKELAKVDPARGNSMLKHIADARR